jgi:urease gamma subunit
VFDLVVTVFASVALTAIIAGLTAALVLERARRGDLAAQLAEANRKLDALERVARNPLYQESLEDQRARQLNAADSVAVGVEHMLNAIRILSPEMLKKGKKK